MKKFGAALLEEVLTSESKILSFVTSSSDNNIIYPLVQDGWERGEPNLVNSKSYPNGISINEIIHQVLIWLISKNVVFTVDKNILGEVSINYSIQSVLSGNVTNFGFNKTILDVANQVFEFLKKEEES